MYFRTFLGPQLNFSMFRPMFGVKLTNQLRTSKGNQTI